jgi:hypothetical protein
MGAEPLDLELKTTRYGNEIGIGHDYKETILQNFLN